MSMRTGLAGFLQDNNPMNAVGQREPMWHERITANKNEPFMQPTSPWMPSNIQPDYNAAPNARVYTPEDVAGRMLNPPMSQSEHQPAAGPSNAFGGLGGLAEFLQMQNNMPPIQRLPQPYTNPQISPFE